MTNKKIEIKVARYGGPVKKINLPSGATVEDALWKTNYFPEETELVKVAMRETDRFAICVGPSHMLKNGNFILVIPKVRPPWKGDEMGDKFTKEFERQRSRRKCQ